MHVMGIAGQNVNDSVIQHFFGPIARLAAKPAQQRARCDLHPDACMRQLADHTIMVFDPG